MFYSNKDEWRKCLCVQQSLIKQRSLFWKNSGFRILLSGSRYRYPKEFPLPLPKRETLSSHGAIIGMATVMDGYPLYYEAANEWGLAVAGLNFPENAHYFPADPEKINIAPFELIPWLLGQCKTLSEVRRCLSEINLWKENFADQLPLSPLHWMISDKDASITVECVKSGLTIYENPVGVLTNNPCFDYHMIHLTEFINLTCYSPETDLAR